MSNEPIYFRLNDDTPAMVWPSPDGSEAIVQIGRSRPRIVVRYYSGREDHQSLSEVLLDLLAKTKTTVTASSWHTAMAESHWGDRQMINWSLSDNG